MEEFIRTNAAKFQNFKKNVFSLKQANDFLTKLVERGDIDKMENELNKSLLVSSSTTTSANDSDERKNFIKNFIETFKNFGLIRFNITEQDNKIDKEKAWGMTGTTSGKIFKDKNMIQKKLKIQNKEEEFPTLENIELVQRKRDFQVFDHHYINKLEKGIKVCFCMGTKHPLVGNCLDCGRIQCLQEGDKECIVCGTHFAKRDEYLKQCTEDMNMKKAFNHKEKLLKFQSEFYSKLQIIDDFSDWYEISNNTWISKEHREIAKKRDDEIEKKKEDQDFEYNFNFKTLEITKVYDIIDEDKEKEDLSRYIQDIGKQQKPLSCKTVSENLLSNFNKVISNLKTESNNIKKLAKRMDIDANQKIEKEFSKYNEFNKNDIKMIYEFDNFPFYNENETPKCLSMDQPWASLLIEGFKRFEGRTWNSDYKGLLWIHATRNKPDRDLVDLIESEYNELYKDCKERPPFPKRYPTSCLLGCVDVVDVIKNEVYVKMVPKQFREKTDSSFLFVCKNPKRLEIPIKMPGQHKLYELDKEILERTRDKLMKVNTTWWPSNNIDIKDHLIEIPFSILLKEQKEIKDVKKKNNKLKIINNPFGILKENSIVIINDYISRTKKENILNVIDVIRKDFNYHIDYNEKPYIKYGLSMNIEEVQPVFQDTFKDISQIFKEEKKLKKNLNFKSLSVEYIDWYGVKNFTKSKNELKIIIGNNSILSIISSNNELVKGKSLTLECGDIIYISEGIEFAINQITYDIGSGSFKNPKIKQGVVIVTYTC